MIIISVVVVVQHTVATEPFNRPLWPLTVSSLVVMGPLRGGGMKVDWTEVAGVQCVSLKSKKYYLRDHVYLRWLVVIT